MFLQHANFIHGSILMKIQLLLYYVGFVYMYLRCKIYIIITLAASKWLLFRVNRTLDILYYVLKQSICINMFCNAAVL